MLFSYIRRKINKEVTEEKYWFCNNHILKEAGEEITEVEFIFKYFNFYKKCIYVLWIEQDSFDKTGNKILYLGSLEEGKSGDKIPVYRLVDEYQMMNAIIELKKKIGSC